MNRDIFAILESKRAILTAAGMIWLEVQDQLNVDLGGVLILQSILLGAFVIAEAIRPVAPKGIITSKKK